MLPLSQIRSIYAFLEDMAELESGKYEIMFDGLPTESKFLTLAPEDRTFQAMDELQSVLVLLEIDSNHQLFTFADAEEPRWVEITLGDTGTEASLYSRPTTAEEPEQASILIENIKFVSPATEEKLKNVF